MRYNLKIQNKHGDIFHVQSVDDYETAEKDILDFTKVLGDEAVRKYITDEVMVKYNFTSVDALAKDILDFCKKRWQDREELRFLVRNCEFEIVGMIGIDVLEKDKGDLWYFKISSSPSFMLEAAKAVLPILKTEGIRFLITNVKIDNLRSRNILKEIGFKETEKDEEMEVSL